MQGVNNCLRKSLAVESFKVPVEIRTSNDSDSRERNNKKKINERKQKDTC